MILALAGFRPDDNAAYDDSLTCGLLLRDCCSNILGYH